MRSKKDEDQLVADAFEKRGEFSAIVLAGGFLLRKAKGVVNCLEYVERKAADLPDRALEGPKEAIGIHIVGLKADVLRLEELLRRDQVLATLQHVNQFPASIGRHHAGSYAEAARDLGIALYACFLREVAVTKAIDWWGLRRVWSLEPGPSLTYPEAAGVIENLSHETTERFGFDFDLAYMHLIKELRRVRSSIEPTARIVEDEEHLPGGQVELPQVDLNATAATITFLGKTYVSQNLASAEALKAIVDGYPLTVGVGRRINAKPGDAIRKLPEPIRARCISMGTKGYRWEPNPDS